MELVYLWVEEYKNIKRQGFNFSPRFRCEYDEEKKELKVIDKEETGEAYPKNFFGENINISAIVGENGSGKSNLLDLIINQDEYFGIYVFLNREGELLIFTNKDRNLIISSNHQFILNPLFMYLHGTSLLYLKSYVDINLYSNSNFQLPRRFFKFTEKRDFLSDLHKNISELFNIVSINSKKELQDSFNTCPYSLDVLNQHFTYLKDKYLHQVLKYYPDLEKFIVDHFKIDHLSYKVKDLGSIFKFSPSFKNHYKKDEVLIKLSEEFNKEKSKKNQMKILCLIFCYLEEDNLAKKIINLYKRKIPCIRIHDILTMIRKQDSYLDRWYKYIRIMHSEDINTIIRKYPLFIKKIRREILEFSFTPSMSSGEEKLLYIITNFYDYVLDMKRIGITHFTIIIDEPDTLLHPNWQKKFIYLITKFIDIFFKNDIFNIIITSHSPFILSDLPKENIIFLKKENGNCKNISTNIEIERTFGANIHTLLSHGFFMKDGLMGEFAKSKIESIKEFYEECEDLKIDTEKYSDKKDEYLNKKEEFRHIQSIIGEPFIKNIMKNYLDELDILFIGKNEFIDEEIKRLEAMKD